MKDSKDTEERISDLKNMMHNVKNDDINDSLDEKDVPDVFEVEEDDDYEIVDADEMIKELTPEDSSDDPLNEPLIIDDEYIYNPAEHVDEHADDSDEDSQIDQEYIIQTNFEDSQLDDEDEIDEEEMEKSYYDEDDEYISGHFDSVVHARVGKIPVMAVLSTVIGIIFIIIAIYLSTQTASRLVDNVVSGEAITGLLILGIIGLFLVLIGVYKMFSIKNPYESLTKVMDNLEKPEKPSELKKMETEKKPNVLPKSNIPLNKEALKIGEFDPEEHKKRLEKPSSNFNKIKHQTVKKPADNLTKEIPEPKKTESPKKVEKPKLTKKEIDKKEQKKAQLEGESIDDIFAGIEEIEDIPIVSVDSKEKIENSKKE